MRILVVDDEPLVAEMIRRTLEDDWQVVVRNSGDAALQLLDEGASFDAILTDVVMPGLDGIQLHAELTRRNPALAGRMLFLSGGAPNARVATFLATPGIRSIEKPFRVDDLARKVREVAAR